MHFENFKSEVTMPGDRPRSKRQNVLSPDKLTHYHMRNWVQNAALDEETKVELLKEIAKYPANTMHHFFDNIHKHIARIHKKRNKKEED